MVVKMVKSKNEIILEIKSLKKYFDVTEGWLNKNRKYLHAVDGINLTIKRGETLGIVGESGCGKSTLGNVIMNLLEPTEGQIIFDSVDLSALSKEELRKKRIDMQMVFQDPYSSLNPRMRVIDIIAEPLRTHQVAVGAKLEQIVYDLMDAVGIDKRYSLRYPHEFSCGQRQRIGIARALALKPKLILCDEPVSSLDVSIQAQILNLLVKLQKEFNLTYIFIAHGLPVVKHISDRIAVMYMGKFMELAPKEKLFLKPLHPYTDCLLASIPISDPTYRKKARSVSLTGELPSQVNPPEDCRFHTRCPFAVEKCQSEEPKLVEYSEEHYVACHYPLQN